MSELAPHLKAVLDVMSQDMGISSSALLNQAVFTLARFHGYVVPALLPHSALPSAAHDEPVSVKSKRPTSEDVPRRRAATQDEKEAFPRPSVVSEVAGHPLDDNLPSDISAPPPGIRPPPEPTKELFVIVNGKKPAVVRGERFLVGRGKHCDLVIDSNRVSREHAAITNSDGEAFIEDLQSSNGSWHNRERITKRKIDDGDEFVLGTERLVFQYLAAAP